MARRSDVAAADDRLLAALRPQHRRRRDGWRATRTPTRPSSPPTGCGAGSPPTPTRSPASPRRSRCRARRSPTGSTSRQFAEVRAFALGLEPPPQMLLFEWDILTGDSAVLDVLYSVARDSGPGRRHRRHRRRPARDRRRDHDARPGRRHRRVDLPRPGAARAAGRLARLPGRPPRAARRLPRDGAAARGLARHRRWTRACGRSARERFDAAAAAARGDVRATTWRCPPTTSPLPGIGEAAGRRDEPMAWLAQGRPARPAARPRPDPHRSRLWCARRRTPWRDPGPVSPWLVVAIPVAAGARGADWC